MHSAIYPTVREYHLKGDFGRLSYCLPTVRSECSVSASGALMLKNRHPHVALRRVGFEQRRRLL